MAGQSVTALGNAIVDILLNISEEEFEGLGLKKGSMSLVDAGQQKNLLQTFTDSNPVLVSGGSIANSIIAFAQLGGDASFTSCIGDDRYGLHYESEFEQLGIALVQPAIVGKTTGTCVVLITPDAERTMQTNLGISAALDVGHVQRNVIEEADWLIVEGYILSSESGQNAARAAIEIAKAVGTRIVVTFSAEFIVQHFKEALQEVTEVADLIIANLEEAEAFTGTQGVSACFTELKQYTDHVVLTEGSKGAHVFAAGEACMVPAVPTVARDVTGAGDMFAGAYLYGICNGYTCEEAARGACFLAHKVIQQIGARLQGKIKEHWEYALSTSA